MADLGITIDENLVRTLIDQAIEQKIKQLVDQLCADPIWPRQVENMINQATVQETLARIGSIDINTIIKERVDKNMDKFVESLKANFSSTGINDQATQCQLTVMDDVVVVENCLTANSLEIVTGARVQDLVVTGSINTDNYAWQALAADISEKTLNQLSDAWKTNLVDQVADVIKQQGIDFKDVTIDGEKLVSENQLAKNITKSNLQTVGTLTSLNVNGEAHINNNAFNVVNKRVGINTDAPEMALSVWDEEVSVIVGKNRANEAYIGTNRDQSVTIGVNRTPQIEINTDGLTRIRQLQVGLHKISHATQVPGWAGTKGDLVFNSNPSESAVFAWVCLGAHRWKTLKSAE